MSRLAALPLVLALGSSGAFADARGDCYALSGDAAIRACTEAIARDPRDVPSYISRAFELQQKGDYGQSLDDYARAIAIDPARWDAFQGRAWAYLKLGKPAEALRDAEAAVKLKPDAAPALDARGHALEALGRREKPSPTSGVRWRSSRACKGAATASSGWAPHPDESALRHSPSLRMRERTRGISPDGCGVDAETECPQFARTAGVRADIIWLSRKTVSREKRFCGQ
jgi:tetratricopeptide (TPR) repeat protein